MKPHILVLNRWPQHRGGPKWDHELCRYDEIIPPHCDVSYLCDAEGTIGLPASVDGARVRVADDIGNAAEAAAHAARLAARHGPITHVFACSEYLLDTAAAIRARFGIPGHTPEQADRFRDKTTMKRILRAADLRVPRWHACTDTAQVTERARELGFPLIIKPVRGASSKGVRRIDSPEELAAFLGATDPAGHEIEEFIDGDILHVDGVIDQAGDCPFICVSRYISSCLGFETGGQPLGSVIQRDTPLARDCKAFALACLDALELRGSAFHLELFHRDGELVFLEVGARVPGADVPYTIHRAYGVNLFQLWVEVMLGHPGRPRPVTAAKTAGWITFPRPRPLPRRVVSANSLVGVVPGLYRELIPAPEQYLKDTGGGYTHMQGGRFLVEGEDESQVLAALDAIKQRYVLKTLPA
ncbi:carboxylate--amine ligase [Achromobacter xylosoxidans]|uniref:ATP-grasp domain-containing protein n=1 Tax=Alcaligenes xylosoxydans xylosoxydans TaxID=85698 RepID=UPI000ACD9E59|nr:ATP-grasp domain-containing protein [Achromobacter xylosoxidans]PWV38303.1 carboxylate--amine ligase [Achromobacter xylosoxidans]